MIEPYYLEELLGTTVYGWVSGMIIFLMFGGLLLFVMWDEIQRRRKK